MTLDELIKRHKDKFNCRELRVRNSGWQNGDWFAPYFCNKYGIWYGLSQDDFAAYYANDSEHWELYEEPKPKKVVYEVMRNDYGNWAIDNYLYEEDIIPNGWIKTGRTFEVDA